MSAGRHNYLLHAGLFLATCVTTTFVGLLYVGPAAPDFWMGAQGLDLGGLDLAHWWRGLAFSGPLMGILLTHEMGHFVAARHHGVEVSLPYFIPVPFGLGTFGAVISMREQIRSRNALMDIGAAGPLAGLAVALPLLVVGLLHSSVATLPPDALATTEGNSILYALLKRALLGQWLPDGRTDVFLSPMAWAAWVGLLVTMLNLIPVGQFDGGHVAFAYFGERYRRVSRWVHRGLPVVGTGVFLYALWQGMGTPIPLPPPAARGVLVVGPPGAFPAFAEVAMRWLPAPGEAALSAAMAALPWFVWGLLAKLIGAARHPPVPSMALSARRRALGIVVLVIFVLIFMPIPLQQG